MRISFAVLLLLSVCGSRGEADDEKRSADAARTGIRPRFQESTLVLGKDSVKATRVDEPWYPEHHIGRHRISVRGDVVRADDLETGKPAWSAKSADGQKLSWLTADREFAYLTTWSDDDSKKQPRNESPASVQRLDLTAGKWLTPVTIPREEKAGREDVVQNVVAFDETVAVLSLSMQKGDDEDKVHSYRVTRFDRESGKQTWTEAFSSAGDRPYTGGYLLAARRPEYASADLQTLSRLRDSLLICAGERQDLICLDAKTGKVSWRTPRLWEFARGFTGPSVWSHHIGPFGVDLVLNREDQKKALAAIEGLRKDQEKRLDCSIVGGPAVVQGKDKDQDSIFVAVARAPAGTWSGYLSDCVVYELDGRSKPLGIVTLPRMVMGGTWVNAGDGVVWACPQGAMVRLAASDERQRLNRSGPGSSDLIASVEWYRQFRSSRPAAWLTADKAGDAVAFTPRHAYLMAAGGYVLRKDEAAYHFPLTVVDLKTGLSRTAVLTVPLAGPVPPPKDCSETDDQISTWGPYLLGVTHLEVHDTTLRVCMGMENKATGVEFDLGKLTELSGPKTP
jgi:outer membrane protein assembly factor BamB